MYCKAFINDRVRFFTADPETSVDPASVLNIISGLVCNEITNGNRVEKSSPFGYLEESFEIGKQVSVDLVPPSST